MKYKIIYKKILRINLYKNYLTGGYKVQKAERGKLNNIFNCDFDVSTDENIKKLSLNSIKDCIIKEEDIVWPQNNLNIYNYITIVFLGQIVDTDKKFISSIQLKEKKINANITNASFIYTIKDLGDYIIIQIKDLMNEENKIIVKKNITIENLKLILNNIYPNIKDFTKTLIYNSAVLKDEQTLNDIGINNYETITFTIGKSYDELNTEKSIETIHVINFEDNEYFGQIIKIDGRIIPNGIGTINYINDEGDFKGSYEGEWVKGKKHGKGLEIKENISIYEGQWQNDKKHGMGIIKYLKNKQIVSSYDGDWQNNERHGKGKETFEFSTYDGDWQNNKRHGYGIESINNGSVYEGQWIKGVKHGKGIETFESFKYDGDWKYNEKNGKGIITSEYSTYDGDWLNNEKHGKGKETSEYSTYEGDWLNGNKHGNGKETMYDGTVNEGKWIIGKKEGKGTITTGDYIENVTWKNDEIISNN